MSAVMALTGWLLVVENGDLSAFSQSATYTGIPQTQALVSLPVEPDIQPVAIGESLQQRVSENDWVYFRVKVPAHADRLLVRLIPSEGDADLYVREGSAPLGDRARGGRFDASSAATGNQIEQVNLLKASDKTWFIGVHGYQASQFQLVTSVN